MNLQEEIRDSWYLRDPTEEYLFAKRREESGEYNWIAERICLNPSDTLLDIGCGSGVFLRYASLRVACAVGIDMSPLMVRYASRTVKGKASVIHGCAPRLPLCGSFSKVTLIHSSFGTLLPNPLLWGIYNDDIFKLSIEMIRSGIERLKPGGKMAVVLSPGSRTETENVQKRFIPEVVSKVGSNISCETHIEVFNSIHMLMLELQTGKM